MLLILLFPLDLLLSVSYSTSNHKKSIHTFQLLSSNSNATISPFCTVGLERQPSSISVYACFIAESFSFSIIAFISSLFNEYKISLSLSTFRTHLLDELYNSCKLHNHDFQHYSTGHHIKPYLTHML